MIPATSHGRASPGWDRHAGEGIEYEDSRSGLHSGPITGLRGYRASPSVTVLSVIGVPTTDPSARVTRLIRM